MAPEVNRIMGRKIGCEMLVVLVTLLHVWLACVTASSSGLRKLSSNHEEEKLRRNLLANGLGRTPPVGYVCVYYNL